jgi:hypothetical protein
MVQAASSERERAMHTTTLQAMAVVPGLLAVLVSIAEMRSGARFADKIRRLAPTTLAVTLAVLFLLLGRGIDAFSVSTVWLAGSMTSLAVVVGLSGALIGYSRRSSSILMALAGFILAYYWAFLSLPRP